MSFEVGVGVRCRAALWLSLSFRAKGRRPGVEKSRFCTEEGSPSGRQGFLVRPEGTRAPSALRSECHGTTRSRHANRQAQEHSSAARARRRSRARAAGRCSRPRPPLVIGRLLPSTYRLVLGRARCSSRECPTEMPLVSEDRSGPARAKPFLVRRRQWKEMGSVRREGCGSTRRRPPAHERGGIPVVRQAEHVAELVRDDVPDRVRQRQWRYVRSADYDDSSAPGAPRYAERDQVGIRQCNDDVTRNPR